MGWVGDMASPWGCQLCTLGDGWDDAGAQGEREGLTFAMCHCIRSETIHLYQSSIPTPVHTVNERTRGIGDTLTSPTTATSTAH